ncbi:hypothetical protein MLD38_006665 [Melastoma candidum]|uniref:Uncharacterized protein n=1 Tax=Melastoma candidum TaxID=119954 RepID=A0ACB9RSD1_9MYRT|nr:hypothetical protein MLD38_006665 [Melastoma candidum]
MTPEIEEVSAVSSSTNEVGRSEVCMAAAYGDVDKLRELVEKEGRSVCDADGSGYCPLQWAALNDRCCCAVHN